MTDNTLERFVEISQAAGNNPDYVQGGGGNTSAKLDDEKMAVKASGYRLNQITPNDGYVNLNYKNIKNFYYEVDVNSLEDYEKRSSGVVKDNTLKTEGLKELRPSVEAGFHSILKKYVIHTHSVYANIICCSAEGVQKIDELFGASDYAYLWIPYIKPGFTLTLKIREGIEYSMQRFGKFPDIIFMENHGLIVNSDDSQECIRIHTEVNEMLKKFLNIAEPYPEITLEKISDSVYASKTGYLVDYFKGSGMRTEDFEEISLYPDQLVYVNCTVSVNGSESKLNIDTATGGITYKTNYDEALAIEETLLGYIYVVNNMKKSGYTIKTLTPEEIYYINNWEGEKYRKNICK